MDLQHLSLRSLSGDKIVELEHVGGEAMVVDCTQATLPFGLLRKSLHQLLTISKYKVIIFLSHDEEFIKELPLTNIELIHKDAKQIFTTTSSFPSSPPTNPASYKIHFCSGNILLYFTIAVSLGELKKRSFISYVHKFIV